MKNDMKQKLALVVAVMLCLAAVTGLTACTPDRPAQEQSDPTTGTTQQSVDPNSTTAPDETTTLATTEPVETEPPAVLVTLPELEGTYEQWLAAAMYYLSFMEYPEYTLTGLYTGSATSTANRMDSQGVYMLLSDGENELLICSKPLADKRSEVGATDLHTAQLGFATFDVVDPATVDLAGMNLLDPNELIEMMNYTVLPALYSN